MAQELINPFVGVLDSLTKELHSLNTTIASTGRSTRSEAPCIMLPNASHRKRKRTENDTSAELHHECATKLDVGSIHDTLEDLSEHIIDAYFRYIHPWISIVHEPSFRNELRETGGPQRLRTIIRAMAVVALRFVKTNHLGLDHDPIEEQVADARREVLGAITNDINAENVQVLLILIFSDVADDKPVMAYSLLAIAWRYIESLGLDLERPLSENSPGIFGRTHKLPTPASWIEAEERRRIFWNAFMLDRLCAALLGQKPTSLSATASPRLPVCGSFWYTNQPRPTPSLHISDSSTAGRAASITPLESPILKGVGSLALYVETMESMSLVMSQFLSLEVDATSRTDVSRWLTRFKELDHYLM